MALAVLDEGDQIHVLLLAAAQQAVRRADEHPDQVDVLPLVEAADVVGLGHAAVVEDPVDRPGVVLDVEPVADVLAAAVDGQRPAVAYVVDEQRYELLGELVGTVVVRAVRYECRHAVGVVVGPDEVVARGFRGRVGAVRRIAGGLLEELLAVGQVVFRGGCRRREGRRDALGAGELQRAVDLVRGDVIEELARIALGTLLPAAARRFEQREGPQDVRAREGEGVADRTVHMALGRQVDDAFDLVLPHQRHDSLEVADVAPHEGVVGTLPDIAQVFQVAGIGQLVEVDDAAVGVLRNEEPYDVRADESGAAGDQYRFHCACCCCCAFRIRARQYCIDSRQWGISTPNVRLIFVLSNTE